MKIPLHRLSENVFMIVAYPIAIAWALLMIFGGKALPTRTVE